MAMQVWQATIVDDTGAVQASASVTVRSEQAGTPLVQLYADRDGSSALGNPTAADSDGFVRFYANPGRYRIDADLGGSTVTWRDVQLGSEVENLAAPLVLTGENGETIAVRSATEEHESVSGASVTSAGLVPAGARVLGVVSLVTEALGVSNGTTGYSIGDGSDADRWGAVTGTGATDGETFSDSGDFTADPEGWSATAQDVVVTATGGNFDGTGSIRVTAFYRDFGAPTS